MQVKALVVSLFLAATATAAPTQPRGNIITDNPITAGGAIANNPVANGNGVGVGKRTENNPVVGSGNKGTGDTNILNDSLNIANGADSHKLTEEVVAALKTLTMTCTSAGEGAMSCTWKS